MKGTLKFYNRVKGYGFITGSDGLEFFVHYTGMICDKKILRRGPGLEGAAVEFELGQNERGSMAINVKVLPA